MIKHLLSLLFVTYTSVTAFCQIGGKHVYSFLSTPSSAYSSSLGGSSIISNDGGLATAEENPASLSYEYDKAISVQHQFLIAGIQQGYAAFGKSFEQKGIMTHGSFKYITYGTFDATDVFGNNIGTVKGGEVAISAGASYRLYENLTVGTNVKFISSTLDTYGSSGLAIDLAAFYVDTASQFTAAFVIKDLGAQLSTYDDVREKLPLNISFGISKRLKYLPFRFGIILHDLNEWNLLYDDPNSQETGFFGGFQPVDNEPGRFDNFFRHVIFNGELLLGKSETFRIRLGYNHQRKQELSIQNHRSLTGFSLGFGVKISKFHFDYGLSKWHVGGSTHHLGISTNLKYFTGSGGIL